jgi:hypothetical protein
MQSYLFIGSDYDGLSYPAADDAESVADFSDSYISQCIR